MDKLKITINGVELTVGQAMTVHVALQSLAMSLSSKPSSCGDDVTRMCVSLVSRP